jgi:hypothetical protein
MKQECKDCNKSLEDCTCIQDTINFPKQRLEKYSERFDNDKSAIGNPQTWGKRVLTEEDIFNQRDIDAVTDYIGKETSKQETLEEVAERLYPRQKPNSYYGNIELLEQEAFEQGAKWQSERMYSEEDMLKSFMAGIKCESNKGENFEQFIKQYKNK